MNSENPCMDAAGVIANLVNLERQAARIGDLVTCNFVIEMQDWVLRLQRENLELRRDNQMLRLRAESMRPEPAPSAHEAVAAPPFAFHAIAVRKRQRTIGEAAESSSAAPAALARAV